jgi:2-polyprenyl-3-methyl-5-hydroxy-6-metoxy-1,4-benzoquinol methylase
VENLDLYAKVEPLLGIEEATQELHHYYLDQIQQYKPETLLDVGCGDGCFLAAVKKEGIVGAGIDLSPLMIEKAKAKGLSVACQDIKDAIGAYDVITSIFDVLNFLDKEALKLFLENVSRLLKPGGHFLADINTLYGFSEVAEGVLAYDDEQQSLIVDASFNDKQLHTKFAYFEKVDKHYQKSTAEIIQYFHEIEDIIALTDLELQIEMPVNLYGDEADKAILCFEKRE